MALAFAILSPPLTPFGEKRNSLVVAKAVGDSSESSSGSIVKSVQTAWSSPEDRLALAGLGFAGLVYIWAARNLISAVDKLPLLPSFFEFIGILYSSWFVYRYLLFKPDRYEPVNHFNFKAVDYLNSLA
ncbi:Protein CURVATURE THYLAKOID 1C [Carex littledalei]|uniref:Protein CURVATURE THYLAKOID 1C n=1 Tax=Carex littledalei TaxID=544730 RepID=A0A833RH81_9POAL|nr:Protein CURVATURE THYLAKOID 1C [Carex littledalei]